MKLQIFQNRLNEAIQNVSKAVAQKEVMPIITGIHFEAKDNHLTLKATDLEYAVKQTIECEVEEEGSVVIPLQKFKNYISKLPDCDIQMEVDDNNKAIIKTNGNRAKFNGLNSDDFPEIENVNGDPILIEGEKLDQLLNKVNFATHKNPDKQMLSCVNIDENDDTLTTVATNTHRLSCVRATLEGNINLRSVIIPSKVCSTLMSLLTNKEVEIYTKNSWLKFVIDNIEVYARLVSGEFPDYNSFIPDDYNYKVIVKRKELKSALERCIIFNDEGMVRIQTEDNNLQIGSVNYSTGEVQAVENMECDNLDGDFSINLNGNYILDGLKVVDSGNVVLSGTNEEQPFAIEEEDNSNWVYVIMPIRK